MDDETYKGCLTGLAIVVLACLILALSAKGDQAYVEGYNACVYDSRSGLIPLDSIVAR